MNKPLVTPIKNEVTLRGHKFTLSRESALYCVNSDASISRLAEATGVTPDRAELHLGFLIEMFSDVLGVNWSFDDIARQLTRP